MIRGKCKAYPHLTAQICKTGAGTMKDIVHYPGLKRLPFEKNLKSADAVKTVPSRECAARLDFIKRRGGIMLLIGDP